MSSVCILMAAYEGEKYIEEQIQSVIAQTYGSWRLFISIDNSNDSTFDIITNYVGKDDRITLLNYTERFGSASKNFYYLMRNVLIQDFQYVAFADQDDVWNKDKLERGISILDTDNFDCYSSSIRALFSGGKSVELRKAHPQTNIDYKFESAGPGCTYIIRTEVAKKVVETLTDYPLIYEHFYFHDWLIYYVARNENYKWFIDSKTTMHYRQHSNNVVGANIGVKAVIKRVKLLRSGWYFDQVYLLENLLSKRFPLDLYFGKRDGLRLKWLFRFFWTRRKTSHSFLLGLAVLLRIVK